MCLCVALMHVFKEDGLKKQSKATFSEKLILLDVSFPLFLELFRQTEMVSISLSRKFVHKLKTYQFVNNAAWYRLGVQLHMINPIALMAFHIMHNQLVPFSISHDREA